MAVYSGALLSGSTNGLPILVAGTGTGSATTIHTAGGGTTGFDEVYLWAANVTAAADTLTIEWGGATDPGNLIIKSYSIPAYSLPIPIAIGQRIQNAKVIKAFSATGSTITVTGYVNQVR